MSDLTDKQAWVKRYSLHYQRLVPTNPIGQLPEIAETYWYYLRHRDAEQLAGERACGHQVLGERSRAWMVACSEELQVLEPTLSRRATDSLAQDLWNADWMHVVDPHVMARSLSDRLEISRAEREYQRERPFEARQSKLDHK